MVNSFETLAMESQDISEISEESLEKYRNQKAYKYVEAEPDESDTFFEKLYLIISELFSDIFGSIWGMLILKVLPYIMIAFVLFAFLWYFLVSDAFNNSKSKLKTDNLVSISPDEEEIKTIDFVSAIHSAEADGEYRLATRYLFLNLLKQLEEKALIEFLPEKTNMDYILELNGDYRKSFVTITKLYEKVWYGVTTPEVKQFEFIKLQFESFNNPKN
jgi:hypothetical protein